MTPEDRADKVDLRQGTVLGMTTYFDGEEVRRQISEQIREAVREERERCCKILERRAGDKYDPVDHYTLLYLVDEIRRV